MVKFGKEFYGKIWPRRVPRERNPRNASRQSARIRLMPWTPIIMQDWRIRIWRTYRGGFGPRVDRERGVAEGRGGEVAQGCKTPWNYQQSLPSPCGWMGGTDSVHSAPLDHRPTGYLSCLLVYEIQHCYLAPHRRVLGTVRPLVSAEFPTLKGRVLVRDFTVTYPRFFLPCTIVFNQAGRHVLERENLRELDERISRVLENTFAKILLEETVCNNKWEFFRGFYLSSLLEVYRRRIKSTKSSPYRLIWISLINYSLTFPIVSLDNKTKLVNIEIPRRKLRGISIYKNVREFDTWSVNYSKKRFEYNHRRLNYLITGHERGMEV